MSDNALFYCGGLVVGWFLKWLRDWLSLYLKPSTEKAALNELERDVEQGFLGTYEKLSALDAKLQGIGDGLADELRQMRLSIRANHNQVLGRLHERLRPKQRERKRRTGF